MMVTANDNMSIDIFNEAYNNQMYVRQLFIDITKRIVELIEPDTSTGIATIPYPDLINIIERNIDTLIAGGYRPPNMQNTVDWLGEMNDFRRLSYLDVNRWFESLEQLEGLIYGIAYRSLLTGNFGTGNNRTRQIIRTVR